MTAHAPGPWIAQHRHITAKHPNGKENWMLAIADCDDNEYAEANAALIASAPDLLAACKAMLEAWDCRCPEAGIVKITSAIAKAEGRE